MKKKQNVYVFGDIHGNYKALREVLDLLWLKPEDKLIFLGDYVDGKPQSKEVIECLINLDKVYDCVFIKGNHDKWAYDYCISINGHLKGNHEHWFKSGGKETYDSIIDSSNSDFKRYNKFFESLKNYYVLDNNLFVHGGFDLNMGFKYTANSSPDILLWDRELWEKAVTNYRNGNNNVKYDVFDNIFIGHTSLLNYPHLYNEEARKEFLKSIGKSGYFKDKFGSKLKWKLKYIEDIRPVQCGAVINMDTGAGSFGKVSCFCLTDGIVYQSKTSSSYYKLKKV